MLGEGGNGPDEHVGRRVTQLIVQIGRGAFGGRGGLAPSAAAAAGSAPVGVSGRRRPDGRHWPSARSAVHVAGRRAAVHDAPAP